MSNETSRRLTTDPLMTIEAAVLNDREICNNRECRTRLVIDDFYQCQIFNPDCGSAIPFGTSHLCMSASRREFTVERWQREGKMFGGIL